MNIVRASAPSRAESQPCARQHQAMAESPLGESPPDRGRVAAMSERAAQRGRIAVLCICTLLFLVRVLGQLEVLLMAPAWLPPMNDWYSGLIPYPILLPLQIALLMMMAAVVTRERQAGHRAPGNWQRWVRALAIVYFTVMLLRLIVQLMRGADSIIEAGGIPVAFHWVLALFLLVLARRNPRSGRLACLPAWRGMT